MTSQQQANVLLRHWQSMPEGMSSDERLERIDFIRRSMGRPECNDNAPDTPEQLAVMANLNAEGK